MNRERELAKNTLILTIGKICTQFVSFLLLPLYTALLIPEEMGVVDLFNTYILLLVPIFNWQFENGMFRFMIDSRGKKEEQKTIFSTVIIGNIVQIIVYLMFYAVASRFISSPYKIFLAIDVALNILLNTLLQFPRGIGDNTTYAFGSFVSAASSVLLNTILIAGFRMGAYGMFIATVLAKSITILFLAIKCRVWGYFQVSSFNKIVFKEISKYSLPLVPNQLSWWVIGASDRTVVSYFISVAANGVYSIANRFSSMFATVYNIFHLSWTESVSLHIDEEDSQEFISDIINTVIKLFLSLCMCIIAVMPFIFPLLINEQYQEAYYQIPILILSVFFQVIVGLYSVIYTALKKSVEIMKTSIYAAVINLSVDFLLIHYIGLYAASVSTLVAYLSMALYRYFHVRKFIIVKVNYRTIIWGFLLGIITIFPYYMKNFYLKIAALIIVVVISIYLNKQFILQVLGNVKHYILRLKRNSRE